METRTRKNCLSSQSITPARKHRNSPKKSPSLASLLKASIGYRTLETFVEFICTTNFKISDQRNDFAPRDHGGLESANDMRTSCASKDFLSVAVVQMLCESVCTLWASATFSFNLIRICHNMMIIMTCTLHLCSIRLPSNSVPRISAVQRTNPTTSRPLSTICHLCNT